MFCQGHKQFGHLLLVLGALLTVRNLSGVAAQSSASPYNYAEALHKSLIYFQVQRSGTLSYQRLAWRTNSCSNCQGPQGEDLSGGYWEAGGSYLKVAFPQAFAITQLAWAASAFPSGLSSTGEMGELLEAIKWGTDFIMASMPNPNQYVVLYGNVTADFLYYGPPEDYEMYAPDGGSRTVTYASKADPSSESAGEGAAALAAAAVVFQASNTTYAATLISTAKVLYALAKNNPGTYMTSGTPAMQNLSTLYPSTGFHDELGWAALWLFKATNDSSFLSDATSMFAAVQGDANGGSGFQVFSWDVKTPGYNVLLASVQPNNTQAMSAANAFFQAYIPGSQRTVPHTANGLAYPWSGAGSLRTASNAAMLGLVHASTLRAAGNSDLADQIMSYSLSQLNFVLGDGGRSWLVGFGKNPPQLAFQKTAWNSYLTWFTKGQSTEIQRADFQDNPNPNRFIAYGALVGGPFDQSGVTYQDRRLNYTFVEPALDYSSGLVGAIAAAVEHYGSQVPYTDCGLDLGWSDPHAGPQQTWPASDCYHQCCSSGSGSSASTPSSSVSTPSIPTTPVKILTAPTPAPASAPATALGRRHLLDIEMASSGEQQAESQQNGLDSIGAHNEGEAQLELEVYKYSIESMEDKDEAMDEHGEKEGENEDKEHGDEDEMEDGDQDEGKHLQTGEEEEDEIDILHFDPVVRTAQKVEALFTAMLSSRQPDDRETADTLAASMGGAGSGARGHVPAGDVTDRALSRHLRRRGQPCAVAPRLFGPCEADLDSVLAGPAPSSTSPA